MPTVKISAAAVLSAAAVDYSFLSIAIFYLWPRPVLLFVILGLNLFALAAILPIPRGRFLRTALAAAVLGGVGEYACVHHFRLWWYAEPTTYAGLPIWIPLIWANLFLLFIQAGEIIEGFIPALPAPLRFAGAAAFLLYLGQAMGRPHPYISLGFALVLAAVFVWFRTRVDIICGVVGGVVGTFGEILAMRAGYWRYFAPVLHGDWFERNLGIPGIPITLPLAWGLSAILIRRMGGPPESLRA